MTRFASSPSLYMDNFNLSLQPKLITPMIDFPSTQHRPPSKSKLQLNLHNVWTKLIAFSGVLNNTFVLVIILFPFLFSPKTIDSPESFSFHHRLRLLSYLICFHFSTTFFAFRYFFVFVFSYFTYKQPKIAFFRNYFFFFSKKIHDFFRMFELVFV